MSVADEPLAGGGPTEVQRRAPYAAASSAVGARGRRARQRILDAALEVFADVGYHRCGISRITAVAGCSRAAFYQYFSSREDVFRHLAGQVSRQLAASAEALEPITPDLAGWTSLRSWIDRHHAIYERCEPVFRVFQAAVESDAAVALGAAEIEARDVATAQAKLAPTIVPDRHVGDVLALFMNLMSWTPRFVQILQSALPPSSLPPERFATALADVAHRTLFGLRPDVNVRPVPDTALPRLEDRARLLERLTVDAAPKELSPGRTLDLLVDTTRDVLVRKGYHETRVDDVTGGARLAHGVFYRYFGSKDHAVRFVALRALQQVFAVLDDIPEPGGGAAQVDGRALRLWLERYRSTQAAHTALVRAWIEATGDDPRRAPQTAAALDLGWQRLVRFLAPRGFGDVEADALLMIPLLDAVEGVHRVPAGVEAVALLIEHGLLGRRGTGPS